MSPATVTLSGRTSLHSEVGGSPIQNAIDRLRRDWQAIFSADLIAADSRGSDQIRLRPFDPDLDEEAFRIRCDVGGNALEIESGGELGCVYAVHALSTRILGTDPFDFWTDAVTACRDEIPVEQDVEAAAQPTRWRGWFINDEDCLLGWHDDLVVAESTWRGIFETALRAGYNTIIPGTGIAPDAPQLDLAASHGLWIAQHHAEPLGAELFGNAHPGKPILYPECRDELLALYDDAIRAARGRKTIWTLGLRGLGDKSFADEDARFRDPAKLGALISEIARGQRRRVEAECAEPQHFAYYLYSESLDLFRAGHLTLDPDVILVWSDNGFGGMRRRRNLSERSTELDALPNPDEARNFSHGLYYHVSFYDVQVAGKLAPWVAPAVIRDQVGELQRRAPISFAILNVSNVKPFLAQIEVFRRVLAGDAATDDWWRHRSPIHWLEIVELERRYFEAHPVFGSFTDSRMGEMAGHILLRALIRATLTDGQPPRHLSFVEPPVNSLEELLVLVVSQVDPTIPEWIAIREHATALSADAGEFFRRDLGRHCLFKAATFTGLSHALHGLRSFLQADYEDAFIALSRGLTDARTAQQILTADDHGRWEHFHRGDWLTNVPETIRHLTLARDTARLRGDPGWSWDSWSSRAGQPIKKHLVTVTARTFDSDKLASLMEA
jgi:hypothetical protein